MGATLVRIIRRAFELTLMVFVGGILIGALAQNAPPASTNTTDPTATYCKATGGTVERRVPYFGTNGPQKDWLQLAGAMGFCQYTQASDGSRIHISLDTLLAKQPSLAALAYYAQVAWNGQGQGNPASLYCTQLGGSDLFGGANLNGGGWVEFGSIDESLEACIFPDRSTIDSWGLLYHSANIIRGTDLAKVLRYPNPYNATKESK